MSKMKYYNQAEALFLQDNLSVDEICKNLNVSRRTLFYWRTKYEWDRKKAEKLANKEGFSKELQSFTEKLMAKLTMDMQNNQPVNQSEYYTLTNLLKYSIIILRRKKYMEIGEKIYKFHHHCRNV